MIELDRRYREVLHRTNVDHKPLDIPYLHSTESTALLEAELRLHLTDMRIWNTATPLLYRHLMRSGLSPADVGAIIGRAGHTIRTSAASYNNELVTMLRRARDSNRDHGYSQVSAEDIALISASMNYTNTQAINQQHQPHLQLNTRLYI